MPVVLRWWWPTYAFLITTAYWPGALVDTTHLVRIGLTVLAVIGAGMLEGSVHGKPDWRNLARVVKQHPLPFVAFLYGAWTIFVSLVSKNPTMSLTGGLVDYSDGALWTFSLSLVLILVYIRTLRDPGLERRLIGAMGASVGLMGVAAVLEFVLRRGLVYTGMNVEALPQLMFPGPGHLAGFLVLGGALMVGWWFRSSPRSWSWRDQLAAWWVWGAVLASSIALALTNRRTAIPALVVSLVAGVRKPVQLVFMAVVMGAGLLIGNQMLERMTVQGANPISNTNTLYTRSSMWKATLKGIEQRPITGWGGSQFQYFWYSFLTPAEFVDYVNREYNAQAKTFLEAYPSNGTGSPLVLLRLQNGKMLTMSMALFKAHNQWLDIAVMWGLVGLALYVVMALLVLKQFYLPGVVALGCYQVFLLLWYVPLTVEGVLFLLVGFSGAMGARLRATSASPVDARQQVTRDQKLEIA